MKRRELRLKRESEGIKALVSGLVGGSTLLAEWERGWHAQYGGDEMDEVVLGDSDAEDEDGSEAEDEKPKKKAKVTPPKKQPVPPPTATAAVPGPGGELKRKRGRPRKVQPGAVPILEAPQGSSSSPVPSIQSEASPGHSPEGGRYLLAIFLLFSFFNGPADNGSAASEGRHSHTGVVLTSLNNSFLAKPAAHITESAFGTGLSWTRLTSYAHTLVTILLFFSVVFSFLPTSSKRNQPVKSAARTNHQESNGDRSQESLRATLGCERVGGGTAFFAALRCMFNSLPSPFTRRAETSYGPDRQTWTRLAGIDAAQGKDRSLSTLVTED